MNKSTYDVAVVGGGPAGCAAAIAHAQRGASVLCVEADPRAARRFAGEWLHPTGVEVLDELRVGHLEKARARAGYGFVIFPDDGSEPIEMPYSRGVALSAEHHGIVEAMREAVRATAGVDLVMNGRAALEADGSLRVERRKSGRVDTITAGRVIGADGRTSDVRQHLDASATAGAPLSYMAALELRDVELPREGFGHLVLGGPGPALLYRIADGLIRVCLDVPIALGPHARSLEALWDGFAPVMPESLRPALRAALERGPTGWAINRFRPRTFFGRDHVRLVGDAVGHVHPMTAMGMTLGLLDARALAATEDLDAYATERRSYVPELLSNALYHCFRREDASATAIRRTMFEVLRSDPRERRRTMDILAHTDVSRRSFGSAFLRIAARAIGDTVTAERPLARLAGFREWIQWPAALVVPSSLDDRVRAKATSTHPIPQIAPLAPTAAPVAPPAEPGPKPEARIDLTPALERDSAVLLRELEHLAMRIGEVPDAALAGPALSCMRAITSTKMRIGMAARMTIGRRRLAVEGFGRLLDARPECRHLAELCLVLLDGAAWDQVAIDRLSEGVRALLDCQTAGGGFARTAEVATSRGAAAELERTSLACRALDVVARAEVVDADPGPALERAAKWVCDLQRDDGSWGEDLSKTAWAIEALIAAGVHPGDPAVRRGVRWLSDALDPAAAPVELARAVRALVCAGVSSSDALQRAAATLAEVGSDDWRVAREVVEALGACEARRAERPIKRGRRRRRTDTRSPIDDSLEADWAFCKESLADVSRTFAIPIGMLSPKLEVAVTVGYLLCRIADTVEDHVAVDDDHKDELFTQLCRVLERGDDPRDFALAFQHIDGDDAELALARELPRVMRVFEVQDAPTREACVRWVTEMARGMSLYTHRRPAADGIAALHTIDDLERYCYYVAGTVGHLLTDLFIDAIGEDPEGAVAIALRDHAEGFATGLQLTNILKDVTDDLARGVSFVPRAECARQGLAVAALADPKVRDRAHAAVAPIYDIARGRLDQALEYALLIPADQRPIRLFCLLPLWMAARTLAMAKGNDAMFEPELPVKISRAEVQALIAEIMTTAEDDDALRARYARLHEPPRSAAAQGTPS